MEKWGQLVHQWPITASAGPRSRSEVPAVNCAARARAKVHSGGRDGETDEAKANQPFVITVLTATWGIRLGRARVSFLRDFPPIQGSFTERLVLTPVGEVSHRSASFTKDARVFTLSLRSQPFI